MIAQHESANEEILSLAALYSMKALDGAEATEFEAHLNSGCRICRSEVAGFERAAADLGHSVPLLAPPPRLRERLLIQVAREKGFEASRPIARPLENLRMGKEGLLVLFSSQMDWQGPQGGAIQTKELFADVATRYSTYLLRAAAGTSFPGHRHAGTEEVYVVDGDFHVGDLVLRPGDYCRAESGTVHEDLFTESGCMLLVHASQLDEIVS